ncbi:kinetochore protein SPC24 homolog [Lotus japonicus]|uniref:kinetochore protein SPC24 homolog n=1 Tax=Lotus japonicus TaxID=34305 RepID=UPI002588BE02|nr:kinetochore protein SPC24 homolog [Lotus japonicus]XP_057458925.1 kinetochore protein SPC24 homolog [Lotus japonicus]XP_057458926.1 kinetochore protein SPC24 homolog [Lotus japonicus]XP_057458928.1 kinetochore protein SPC24 homolog [Lotus japonicus]
MADSSRNVDVEELISYSDDLLKVLRDPRDLNGLFHCLQHSLSLSSTCDSDLNDARSLLQDYQKKIDAYKRKIEEAGSETVADAELDLLQRELEEELEKERLLKEEFRAIRDEFNDLEQQRMSIQEQKKALHKIEQDKLRTQMTLSMYASVTNIVPNLDDQSKISGYIVEKDKNAVQKFDYDTTKMTILDVCNDIWKTISA